MTDYQVISLTTELNFANNDDKQAVIAVLTDAQLAFNECSKVQFALPHNNIVSLHAGFYRQFRDKYPEIKSAVVVAAQRDCLAKYRSVKSNKHKITKPIVKRNLSLSLNHTLYSLKNDTFRVISSGKRIKANYTKYPKLVEYITKYKFRDVSVYSRGGRVFVTFPFKIPVNKELSGKCALGVDLGIRRFAATSEGKLFISKEYNANKRKLRYLKRCLNRAKAKGSKSAKKHLWAVSRKERNVNKNFNHHLANQILDTKANTIVLEDIDVSKLKGKKHRYQNKNRISQVSFYAIKQFLTYKALFIG